MDYPKNLDQHDMLPLKLSKEYDLNSPGWKGLGILTLPRFHKIDLQRGDTAGILGAVQKAGTAYNTFKKADIGGIIREEATGAAKDVIRAGAPGATRAVINKSDSVFFPTPPKR